MATTKEKVMYALVSLMDEHGTKGTELADALGVKKQSVSGWRSGKNSMDLDNMIAVCDYYKISLDEFVGRGNRLEEHGTMAVSENERELLEKVRALDADKRRFVEEFVEKLS